MTKQLRKAIEIICQNLEPKNILEIGSRQAKNQRRMADLRSLFPKVKYLGTDMIDGPGVDRVIDAERLPFAYGSFDLVLCLETFEHARKPWLVSAEIKRVVSDRGVIIISSQQNFPLHRHPSDYFRYTPYGLASLFDHFKSKLLFTISPPFENEVKTNPQHVVLVASKKENAELMVAIGQNLLKNKSVISVHKPYRHRLFDLIKFFKRGLAEMQYRQEIEFF